MLPRPAGLVNARGFLLPLPPPELAGRPRRQPWHRPPPDSGGRGSILLL